MSWLVTLRPRLPSPARCHARRLTSPSSPADPLGHPFKFVLLPSTRQKVHILYSGHNLLVINKPPGLVSQAVNKEGLQLTRVQAGTISELLPVLQEHLSLPAPPLPLHRLDKPVTGCLLLSTSPRSASALSRELARREVDKTYLALVRGDVAREQGKAQGTVECWLRREGRRSGICQPGSGGKRGEAHAGPALCTTDWEVLDYSPKQNITLLALHLITGFYHQLRVHCAQVLHAPILGDTAYDPAYALAHPHPHFQPKAHRGPKPQPQAQAARSSTSRELEPLPPLMLHASLLSLHRYHPSPSPSSSSSASASGARKGKRFRLTVRAPLPAEFLRECERAGIRVSEREREGGVWVDGVLLGLEGEGVQEGAKGSGGEGADEEEMEGLGLVHRA
ncbi:pseudouridine synthase [Calocera viscosa TUFC12733]|uniref:21S rRNA pseudouridine(2819) synthase n=1 Tax=Calocera viscosa (strain TUFC12733) TaxID=1330018 RepID=A0A167FV76_CALVF|nr:pseudouridine synthase [Calocera viscosa TUFC12733]